MSAQRPLGMGGSRELLTEMKPNGSRNFESPVGDIVGTHTGFYVGLNLHNPRPGYHYEWGNNRASYRLINRQKGFEMIAATDDDAPACFADIQALQDDTDTPTPQDTEDAPFPDLIPMRIREDKYAVIQDEISERTANAMGDQHVQGWINSSYATGERGGSHNPRGVSTRFATTSHSVQMRDGDNQITDQWVPQRGTTERGG